MDSGVANEQWRIVPSIPGLYISSDGRVKTQRKGGKLSSPYRPNQDKNSGYRYVCKKRLGNLMLTGGGGGGGESGDILTDLLGCSCHQGSISKVVLGSMKSTNGWQFRLA
jgi:hypothetical protein